MSGASTAPTTRTSPSGLNNLASLLQDTGRHAEAENPLYRRAGTDSARSSYCPDHPKVAATL